MPGAIVIRLVGVPSDFYSTFIQLRAAGWQLYISMGLFIEDPGRSGRPEDVPRCSGDIPGSPRAPLDYQISRATGGAAAPPDP